MQTGWFARQAGCFRMKTSGRVIPNSEGLSRWLRDAYGGS